MVAGTSVSVTSTGVVRPFSPVVNVVKKLWDGSVEDISGIPMIGDPGELTLDVVTVDGCASWSVVRSMIDPEVTDIVEIPRVDSGLSVVVFSSSPSVEACSEFDEEGERSEEVGTMVKVVAPSTPLDPVVVNVVVIASSTDVSEILAGEELVTTSVPVD